MKFLLTTCLLLLTVTLFAQNLTGVWRGYFISGMGTGKQRYKYEVQIENKPNNGLGGVTYSYRTTVFYGKASLQGIFMKKDKSLILKENSLLDVKIMDESDPCLMTCYLEYTIIGGVEILEGTFSSINMNNKTDCGSGTVYLERVEESDFKKEDFIVKYEAKKKIKQTPVVTGNLKAPANSAPRLKKSNPAPRPLVKAPAQKPTPPSTPPTAGGKKTTVVPKPPVTAHTKPAEPAEAVPPPVAKEESTPHIQVPSFRSDAISIPKVLRDRENSLVRTLFTSSKTIKIQLYDNGHIDDDTISVYHNNQVIVHRKRLSHEPITLNLAVDQNNPVHEFVMVAENLGAIPPNTALMVITIAGKRHELYIVSNEQKNAKVVIEYVEE